jgi:mannitol/fructose-specific phosphotransferase system IIA component
MPALDVTLQIPTMIERERDAASILGKLVPAPHIH